MDRMLWECEFIHLNHCSGDSFIFSVQASAPECLCDLHTNILDVVVYKIKWPVGYQGETVLCLLATLLIICFKSLLLFFGLNTCLGLRECLGSVSCEAGRVYSLALKCYLAADESVPLFLD